MTEDFIPSKEDIKKTVSDEMKLFMNLVESYPNLKKYENQIKEQFHTIFNIFFGCVSNHKGKLYSSNFLIIGIILRTLNVYRGCLWSLGFHNPHVFYSTLRNHCETLALVYYCVNHPKYSITALAGKRNHEIEELRIRNTLTMIEKLDGKYGGIMKDYDQLSERVHPNPHSLFANMKPTSERNVISIQTKIRFADSKYSEEYILMLVNWTKWIFDEINNLKEIFKNTGL